MPRFRVASISDLAPGSLTRVEADGVAICLVRTEDGALHAVEDACTHERASLSEGFVEGSELECAWHGSVFDVRTGAVLGSPAVEALRTFRVSVEAGDVVVKT